MTTDDISETDNVKTFLQSYQSFIRERMYVFLLLAELLYENVSDITNDKNLTFLLRTPILYLSKLNHRDIALSYREQFSLDLKDTIKIAKLTKGYPYAYQLLGNLLYRSQSKNLDDEILKKYDMALENNVYAKNMIFTSKELKR